MPFETQQRVLREEAEPDWVQFQSFVFVHRVLLCVDLECFLDSPLQTVTFVIDHFHIVEIKGMLFEDRMLSSSRHVKSSVFDAERVLFDAYTGCASRFSNVCLFTVATLETKYNTWVILSNGPIFQLLLERLLPVSWLSNYSYIQRPQSLDWSASLSAAAGATTSSFFAFQLLLHSDASISRLVRSFSCCWSDHFQFLSFPTILTFRRLILSTGLIFQLLLERPLPVSWLSNYSYIQTPHSLDFSDLSAAAGATTFSFLAFQLLLHSDASFSRLVRSFSCCWSDHFQFLGFPTILTFRRLILSTGPFFQLLLERPLPFSWLSSGSKEK